MVADAQYIHSPGKLMLTGEYFVLDGVKTLAVPTVLGQSFQCVEEQNAVPLLTWNAFHLEKLWLSFTVNYRTWEIIATNDIEATDFIVNTLKIIQKKSKTKLQENIQYSISTRLEFPPDYGLGSSSTLMTNLGKWTNIDAFELNAQALGGSGYDIAVAICQKPIIYALKAQKPTYTEVQFSPTFRDEIIFIHLGKKQNSREGIKKYRTKEKSEKLILQINDLTEETLLCDDIATFSELMVQHENIVSHFLEIPTAKALLFPECPVFIKSLGAWGGDFVMSRKFNGYQDYFASKNITTILDWKTLIKE
ncbi:GYDIA family GHMP kinase [Bergeyella zoohelcum]|uniref:Mevalonate kinase n=1 Tax=Bergeyella zoohelcum TaxID=1015 RepID=A0A376BYU3_9FLAO|nr:GYDIA family GHMP kinase [Bergeyella zoohelcum]EKB61257.1 hypothetical protein HMPREF9700_00752 [Bergeyella zoohelcum CCUG 30536]SSZ46651.1 Uncharacterised protein [Bergeyella zoohelcum]